MDSKGKNQQASEAFMAFLTSSVFAKHLKLDHALPPFLCLFLQWGTLFAINNRTEKQKVINKPYMAKSCKTYFQCSHGERVGRSHADGAAIDFPDGQLQNSLQFLAIFYCI